MLFTDPIFLFYFLPFALLLHYFVVRCSNASHYPRLAGLTLFSLTLIFYGFHEPWWILPFLFGIVFDFIWASLLHRSTNPKLRSLWLTLSVAQNLFLLLGLKYWHFLIVNIAFVAPDLAAHIPELYQGSVPLALPAGISFYTFESLSFVIDIYRRQIAPPKDPLEFFSFIGMFPRFIAGPIVRYKEMAVQFKQYPGPDFTTGMILFAKGLFFKCCFADSFAVFVNYAFGRGPVDFIGAWIGSLAYSLQIYFDFYGYSLIAIGLGHCLGFTFPDNFNRPYFAENISDFWTRWHISLSTWLKDYLYIPLGGSRCVPWKRYRNLMITMALGGLWHGAGWPFFIWGCYHGTLLCLEHRFHFLKSFPLGVRRFLTFLLVVFGWVPFHAASLREAFKICRILVNPFQAAEFNPEGLLTNPIALGFCLLGITYLLIIERKNVAANRSPSSLTLPALSWPQQLISASQILCSMIMVFSAQTVPFIYFSF